MKKVVRVYVAGSYSSSDTMQVFRNIRRGTEIGSKVLQAGLSPFVSWLDWQLLMHNGAEALTVADMYRYSMDWLRISDAVLLVPGWENSTGTKKELDEAESLGIPVFEDIDEIINYNKEIM